MNGSFKLGRLAGIDVYMHWTFLLLLGYIGFSNYQAQGSAVAALHGMVLVLAVFGCVVLHELGHALAARRYNIPTRDITLLPIGGVARLERMPDDPRQELVVALAGPAVNVVIASVLLGAILALGFTLDMPSEDVLQVPLLASFLLSLCAINIFLIVFNMIPAFPMDGGRVLRALLASRLEYGRATAIAARVGQSMAILFALVGLFGIPGLWNPQPMLMLIAVFVYFGAEGELRAVQRRVALSGVQVREAMLTAPLTVPPGARLIQVADHLMTGVQRDFPVVEDDRLLGMLRREELIQALNSGRADTPAADNIEGDGHAVDDAEMLDHAQEQMNRSGVASLPVTHEGRFVGLLTRESIEMMLALRAAG